MKLTRKQWMMLAVLVSGAFVTVLNQTLVTPALPSIMVEMSVDQSTAQWLTTGFTLVNAIMIPITAFLQDRFSTRKLFVFSMSLFAVGTLLAAVGLNFPVLLGGRLVQAAGAGILMPVTMTVLMLVFPVDRRGSAMGIFGLVIAFAPAIGPTVAGFVIDQADWHILFYLIFALAIVIIIPSLFLVDDKAPANKGDSVLDPLSLALSTLGFGLMLYGFSALGSPEFYRALFIGTIMTATSVSITVATLQELGHLKSFLGTTIVSAAVIDDVIGIIVLTCVLGASSGEGTGIGGVLIQTVLFFLVAIGVGVVIHFAMKWLDKRNPHTQRITIVSMAFCFAMAYIAEQYFGIADITGAYIAGIVLCAMDDAPYVERRVDISNYVIFAPVFFASIGLKTDISGLTPEILLFCICFVIVALLTKIIGCGLAAKICRFNWGDSLKVGVGMMTRGEVALIVAQKGLEVGVVDPVYFTAVILLIVVSSVATPLALKALFTKMPPVPHPSQTKA